MTDTAVVPKHSDGLHKTPIMIIINISPCGRCPLLDNALPKRAPTHPLHPTASRHPLLIVDSTSWRSPHITLTCTRFRLQDFSSPTAITPTTRVICPLPLQLRYGFGYVSDILLRITSYLILSRLLSPSTSKIAFY